MSSNINNTMSKVSDRRDAVCCRLQIHIHIGLQNENLTQHCTDGQHRLHEQICPYGARSLHEQICPYGARSRLG